jgi:hypothetical protein
MEPWWRYQSSKLLNQFNAAIVEKILRHLKLWDPLARPPPPQTSTTLETDADFLAWEAAGRLFDGID